MFNFNKTRHLMQNPAGSYSFVGSVPRELAYREDGKALTFPTVEIALQASRAVPAGKLCDIPTCACRSLFPAEVQNA